ESSHETRDSSGIQRNRVQVFVRQRDQHQVHPCWRRNADRRLLRLSPVLHRHPEGDGQRRPDRQVQAAFWCGELEEKELIRTLFSDSAALAKKHPLRVLFAFERQRNSLYIV